MLQTAQRNHEAVIQNPFPDLPFFFSFFLEVELSYNVVLVSGIQQSDSVIFFISYSIIGYYKILNIIPCAVRYILVAYLSYIQ